MTNDPFPRPSTGTNPPMPSRGTNPPFSSKGTNAPMPGTQSVSPVSKSWRPLEGLSSQLPRLIGAGLVLLYTLDVGQFLLGYDRGNVSSEFAIESGILEKIPVLLLGFAFLVWPGLPEPRRHLGRVGLKLASLSALAIGLLHMGLGLLCVLSSVRVFQQAGLSVDRQAYEQEIILNRLIGEVPKLDANRLGGIYLQLFPESRASGNIPAPVEKLRAVLHQKAVDDIAAVEKDVSRQRKELRLKQIVATVKYPVIALLAGILYFLIWDLTPSLRLVGILPPAKDPNLAGLSRVARVFRRFISWGETVFEPPDFNNYRWYRHFRRWLRKRFSKKEK
jgi:hypothetical protein